MTIRKGWIRKTMKLEEKKTKKIEIRVSEDDYNMLKIASFGMGQTVSGMLRMIAQATINATKIQVQQGKITSENIKTILDD